MKVQALLALNRHDLARKELKLMQERYEDTPKFEMQNVFVKIIC